MGASFVFDFNWMPLITGLNRRQFTRLLLTGGSFSSPETFCRPKCFTEIKRVNCTQKLASSKTRRRRLQTFDGGTLDVYDPWCFSGIMVEILEGLGPKGKDSSFPKADAGFWAKESACLQYRFRLLEEYKNTYGMRKLFGGLCVTIIKVVADIKLSVVSDAEECRNYMYQTQWLLATIAQKGLDILICVFQTEN